MVSQCSSPVSVLGQIRQAVSSQTLPLRFALMLRLENHTVRIKKCKHNEILLRQPNQERRTAYACTVHETDTKKNKKKNFRPTALPKITRKVNGATKGSDLNMSTHVRDVTPQAIFPAIRTQVTLHISHIYSLLAKATYIHSDYKSTPPDVRGGGGSLDICPWGVTGSVDKTAFYYANFLYCHPCPLINGSWFWLPCTVR